MGYSCVALLRNGMYICISFCIMFRFGPSEDFTAQSVDQRFAQQSEDHT